MHGRLYNEATIELRLRPRTPLLIKSGTSTGLDPTLPDMQFVRTRWLTSKGEPYEMLYIPGSSLRGVLRSHAERLVRTLNEREACHVIMPKQNCMKDHDTSKLNGPEAYTKSCYACRLFGNTALAARVKVGDLYPLDDDPLTDVRHGVAIDRITGAVAHGPFDLETVTDGEFTGTITLRNFTLGHLGLLAAALLDLGDGLVQLGYGKSRGMGRVEMTIERLTFRFPHDPQQKLKGLHKLVKDDKLQQQYNFSNAREDDLAFSATFAQERGFYVATIENNPDAKNLLEEVVPFWPLQLEQEARR